MRLSEVLLWADGISVPFTASWWLIAMYLTAPHFKLARWLSWITFTEFEILAIVWSITATQSATIRILVTAIIGALGAVALNESLRWISHHQLAGTAPATAHIALERRKEEPGPIVPIETPTLLGYFNQDLAKPHGACYHETFKWTWAPRQIDLFIQYRVCVDLDTDAAVIVFFVPKNERFIETVATYQAVAFISRKFKEIYLSEKFAYQANDGPIKGAEDFLLSKRIYIYHEGALSDQQLGELSKMFSDQRMEVEFRSQAYVNARILTVVNG